MENTNNTQSNTGMELMNQGKAQEAIQYYENIISTAPRDLESLYNLAYAYFMQHDHKKATETLEKILSLDDKYEKAYYLLAKVNYVFTSNKEKMTTDILKALKLNPENSYYCSMAALIFYYTNNFNNAFKRANDALHIDPENYEANLVLGAYYKKTDPVRAMEYFRKSLEFGAKQPESQFNILPLHLEITKTKKGFDLIKEMYIKNKDNQAYRWLYKRAYLRNNFLNWPFTFVDNMSISYPHILFAAVILLTLIAIMYSSEELTISMIDSFKWFCSLVLIIFVPYQVLIFFILQLYFELIVIPQTIKA